MAIPEACGLWIEQRVQEELDAKGETGASLREIGRKVAAEVEKYFETKVNPLTLANKASVMNRGVRNRTPKKSPTKPATKTKSNEIKRVPAKDGTMRGGARPGAGRKPKANPPLAKEEEKSGATKNSKSSKDTSGFIIGSQAEHLACLAIDQLSRIEKEDSCWEEQFNRVINWIKDRLIEFNSKQTGRN